MPKRVRNEVNSLSELDTTKLKFDLSNGAQDAHALYFFFKNTLEQDNTISFQCSCGQLGIIPVTEINTPPFNSYIENGECLCMACGKYGLQLEAPPPHTPLIIQGTGELNRIFQKALDDNYMTLCYYLYSSLHSFQHRFYEVNAVCDTIMDISVRNVLLFQTSTDGVGQFKVSENDLRKEEVLLQLMLISHVFELAELPDVLLSILSIAESEHFLIGDDGRSLWPVGLRVQFEGGERDQARKRIVFLRREIHKKNYFKLSRLLKKAFNPEVRNAFSHSEYKIVEDGIILTGFNNRLVTNEDLFEMYMGAYSIQEMIFVFIDSQRRQLIANGGYEECGWKLTPIVDGNAFSVKVSTSNPGGSPTGRVRREQQKKEGL